MTQQSSSPAEEEVTQWLADHGDVLYRYALKRLGSRDIAEDLAQDTFVAALRSRGEFRRHSSVQTWLVGILRHKISDYLRQLSRQRERDAEIADAGAASSPFKKGHWRTGVKAWPHDPARSLENKEFWRVLTDCQNKLPSKLAIVFRLRDLEELPMSEICELLEISTSNLSVRLHRARLLLRDCIDRNWFTTRRNVS